MEFFSQIVGNSALKRYFAEHIVSGRLAHAYLFVGASGSGKTSFALSLAAAMACTDSEKRPCGHCSVCRKLLNAQCADLTCISSHAEKSATIRVDTIRQMKENADIFPNDLDFRIFLIDDASDMNIQAQNALLKLLEEPPANVYLFLLATDLSRLLPTILSRVQVFHMERLHLQQMQQCLKQHAAAAACCATDPKRYWEILRIADGVIGRAQKLFAMTPGQYADADQVRIYRCAAEVMELFAHPARSRAHLLAFLQDHVPDRDQCGKLIDWLMAAMHDLLLFKKGADAQMLAFFFDAESVERVAASLTAAQSARIYESLGDLRQMTQANLNVNSMLCTLVAALYGSK